MFEDRRKRKRQHDRDDMNTMYTTASPSMTRGPARRQRLSFDDFDGVVANELDLELSFASNMSLNSPQVSPITSHPQTLDTCYAPASPEAMEISPMPVARIADYGRSLSVESSFASPMRKRANTVRCFGREMSNGGEPLSTLSTSYKGEVARQMARSALPDLWMHKVAQTHEVCRFFPRVCTPC